MEFPWIELMIYIIIFKERRKMIDCTFKPFSKADLII